MQLPIILVVDNEPQIRSLLNRLLSRQGFRVIEAHDGPTALAAIRARGGEIFALLTDIEMRNMSGIELAKAVLLEFPMIPVLFVSASTISEEEVRRDVPGCSFVGKPFVSSCLIQSLKDLLGAVQDAGK